MPIKRYTLDGKVIHSLEDLFGQLSKNFRLPRHFGGNLDALWDVLSADLKGPFEIVWKDANDSRKVMGADFERVIRLLKELEEERDDFKLELK